MAEDVRVADVVRLKSGGPAMTVTFVQERRKTTDAHWEADCVWFTTEGVAQDASFRFDSLVHVRAGEDVG